jgi:hypothetical protein
MKFRDTFADSPVSNQATSSSRSSSVWFVTDEVPRKRRLELVWSDQKFKDESNSRGYDRVRALVQHNPLCLGHRAACELKSSIMLSLSACKHGIKSAPRV